MPGRGRTYLTVTINLGKYENAIDDFSQSIKLNPKELETYYYRANAYKFLDNKKEAVSDFNTYLKISQGKGKDLEKIHQTIIELGYKPEY